MQDSPQTPALSVMLVMLHDFKTLRKTINALRAQTIASRIEVVITAAREFADTIDKSLLSGFAKYHIVVTDRIATGAQSWALAFAHTTAPYVAMGEDHSFPVPVWAETVVKAHEDGWAVVSSTIENANPNTRISCANFLLCFVDWFEPDQGTVVTAGAGHNSSYRRDVLMQYNADLERWLASERVLHMELSSKGFQIYLAPGARTNHLNLATLNSYLGHSFYGGRLFGSLRSQSWQMPHKIVYILGAPLIPVVRLKRILERLNSSQKRDKSRFWSSLPLIVLGLTFHAIGEVTGYTFGVGNSQNIYTNYELNRRQHLLSDELAATWE